MEFNLENNAVTVKCEGVDAVIYFDGMDVEYCCINNDLEIGVEEEQAKFIYVDYKDLFISVYDLMMLVDSSYDEILNEAEEETGYEADNVIELSSPHWTGRV
jgi:hypothetical protein